MNATQTLKALALAALLVGCSSEEDADEEELTTATAATATAAPPPVEPIEDPAIINAPLALKIVSPDTAKKGGEGFHKQPNGTFALGVTAENASRATYIYINGEKVDATTYGNPTFLSAIVPSSVVNTPGTYEVHLADGKRTSNKMQLKVE